MCNESTILALLSGVYIFTMGVIASIAAAVILNGSFFGAIGAPVPMGVAAGLTSAALASLIALRPLINEYNDCMLEFGEGPNCEGALSNLVNVVSGLIAVFSIQATACFAVLGISWIPWVGTAPMLVIAGALVIQLPLIISLVVFYQDLTSCLRRRISSDEPVY